MSRAVRAFSVASLCILTLAVRAEAVSVTLANPVPLKSETIEVLRELTSEDSDQWKLVAFGFSRCKDVCPKTLGTLSRLVKIASEKEVELDCVFVTVDPDRDTAPVLHRFAAPHGRKISFLRLEDDALGRFKDEFGVEAVFYTKNEGNKFHYQVDHSSMAFLIDPGGRIRVVFDALEDSDSVAKMLREDPEFFE